MRAAGLAAETLDMITPCEGRGYDRGTQHTLPRLYYAKKRYPRPAQLPWFSESICTSINHVVCHGIPGPEVDEW